LVSGIVPFLMLCPSMSFVAATADPDATTAAMTAAMIAFFI
jgi:hypothetical protein